MLCLSGFELYSRWMPLSKFRIRSILTHMASIYANLLEQKKAFT